MAMDEAPGRDICDRSFQFALRVIKLCQSLDAKPGVTRTLSKQLLRSATSVGANVEEAQAGQSRADFISKISIALKEARETHCWLRLIGEAGIIPRSRLSALVDESDELIRILTTIVKRSKRSRT